MKKLSIILIAVFFFSAKFTNSQVYDFDLNDLDGNSVKLTQLLEKGPVMLSFWALWCIPCKEEMKNLSEIYKIYQDSGFVYAAVNNDDTKSVGKVKSYIESKNYKFTVLLDTDKKVFETYGGQNLPFSILLNKKGEVVKTYSGFIAGDESKLEEDIIKVIKESK
ncbi:MAG: TlpA family protein disulfide reductase [Ignavibacteriae bacterium]|nr:MAG: TlpA family protein disulfide reductase [Ignavibacteriota bacterium]